MEYYTHRLTVEKAGILRENLTPCEKVIEERLSVLDEQGFLFYCQYPVGDFVVDFYCPLIRLAVEIDGNSHKSQEQIEFERSKDDELALYGIKKIQFSNQEVLKNPELVLQKIRRSCLIRRRKIQFEHLFKPILPVNLQLKMMIRSLLKSRSYLNSVLISLILTFSFLLTLLGYLIQEFEFDSKIPGHDKIYRITTQVSSEGQIIKASAKTQMPLAPLLKEKLAGIEHITRLLDEENLYQYDSIRLNRQKTYWVDEDFPELFSIEIIEGDAVKALSKLHCGLISEEVARKFFGSTSPIGKILIENEGLNIEIGGVFKKPAYPSHLDFDYIISFKTVEYYNRVHNNWDTDMYYTYIKLRPLFDCDRFKKNLQQISDQIFTGQREKGLHVELQLQPLTTIHRSVSLENEMAHNNMPFRYLIILFALGFLTFLVSLLTFSGLVASRYRQNSSNQFLKKIYGDRKRIRQAIHLEITILLLVSLVFSFCLSVIFGSRIYQILNLPSRLISIRELLVIALILFSTSLVTSSYLIRAMIRTRSRSKKIKKSPAKKPNHSMVSLMILQFGFAMSMIIFLAVTLQQIWYLKTSNPGYSKEQILAIHSPRSLIMNPDRITKANDFFNRLHQSGLIERACLTSDLPGKAVHTDMGGFIWLSTGPASEKKIPTDWISIDQQFFSTLNLEIVAGKNFENDRNDNWETIIINEKAAKELGFSRTEDAPGTTVLCESAIMGEHRKQTFNIIGVVSDYHQEGLQQQIKPLAFTFSYFYLFGFYTLKLNQFQPSDLKTIRKTWDSIFPNDPFDYFFLDEAFDNQYKNEQFFFNIGLSFGLISILIAIIGLIGLSIETTMKQSKQIGIRKINGASTFDIILLLNKDFIKWLSLSLISAIPLAIIALQIWFKTFAFHIRLNILSIFLMACLVLMLAILTVSIQTAKAARKNPADALRYE